MLLVGTTDQDRSFHIIALAVASNETSEDFELLFAAIKKALDTYVLGTHEEKCAKKKCR